MKRFLRAIKKELEIALGARLRVRIDLPEAKTKSLGVTCSWDILTEHIHDEAIAYCFGVGENASFDEALCNDYSAEVHSFDPTPKSIRWIEKQTLPDRLTFHPFGISDKDQMVSFRPPINPEEVSHTMLERPETDADSITVEVKRLSTIMKELGHEHISILKMDVEGAEYAAIEDLLHSGIRPTQILVEFHHRFPSVGIAKTKIAIQGLRDVGYLVYSVSTRQEEICLVHNSALK